jgi:hypothetical protein
LKDYDLIFVVGYFRSATAFLSVIRVLGRRLRIAVISVEADPAMRYKTADAQGVYMDLCCEYGADLLELGESARAMLLVIQQFPYDSALAQSIQRGLMVRERVGLMTLAMAGIDKHDAYLAQFSVRKVYVPSQRFMEFLLAKRDAQAKYASVSVKEVGMPYARHRLFSEFSADWIIAAPTLFSFHNEGGKQHFLRTVNQLLSQIPKDDVVIYKPHNGNRLDYFAPRLHYWLAGWLDQMPETRKLLRTAGRLPWPWLRMQIDRVETCVLHRAILKRATQMSEVTKFAGMSLEAFLPGVRKGVIGGLSNTIWGALYFDLPFFNCVDESARQGRSELLDKRSDALLDLNLQYFYVPFCNGELDMDTRKLGIIKPHERQGNLVEAIVDDLTRARIVNETAN